MRGGFGRVCRVVAAALVVVVGSQVSACTASRSPLLLTAPAGATVEFLADVGNTATLAVGRDGCVIAGDRLVVAAAGSAIAGDTVSLVGYGEHRLGAEITGRPFDLEAMEAAPEWLPMDRGDCSGTRFLVLLPDGGF